VADQYFGKYSGLVKGNQDSTGVGTLQVSVPAIFPPEESVPARAALPYGVYFVPEVGAKVWVEFEGGDPAFPLWTGVQHAPGDWPAEAAADPPTIRAVKTASGHLLIFDDTAGAASIVLTHGSGGHSVTLSQDAIEIVHGAGGHRIAVDPAGIAITHGGGLTGVTIEATAVIAKTAAARVELGAADAVVTAPVVKLGGAGAAFGVLRANVDFGVGNLGAPVPLTGPGSVTVKAM
jgi:hypothetical protein